MPLVKTKLPFGIAWLNLGNHFALFLLASFKVKLEGCLAGVPGVNEVEESEARGKKQEEGRGK